MSTRSYCLFENTLVDLSPIEEKARKQLIEVCRDIIYEVDNVKLPEEEE